MNNKTEHLDCSIQHFEILPKQESKKVKEKKERKIRGIQKEWVIAP